MSVDPKRGGWLGHMSKYLHAFWKSCVACILREVITVVIHNEDEDEDEDSGVGEIDSISEHMG